MYDAFHATLKRLEPFQKPRIRFPSPKLQISFKTVWLQVTANGPGDPTDLPSKKGAAVMQNPC